MKKALISPNENNRVVEFSVNEFPVAEPLFWVDCDDAIDESYVFDKNTFIKRQPTLAELAQQAKQAKVEALNSITVTTSSGKVFDGNETARTNMMSAIIASDFLGLTTANWKLADNTVANVTVVEVKEALALAIQRVGEIVTA